MVLLDDLFEYGIGVDPGWVNMGAATVRRYEGFKFEILHAHTYQPSKGHRPELVVFFAINNLTDKVPAPACGNEFTKSPSITLERYVSYGNVHSTHTEEITEVIGMLKMGFWNWCATSPILAMKAIDWKTKLCQTLVRYAGFNNPSKRGTLDKEFSIAAAKHLTINHEKILDDHQADSVCLAAYPQVMALAAEERANPGTRKARQYRR